MCHIGPFIFIEGDGANEMLGDTNNDEDLQSDNDDSDNDPHYVPVDQEDKGTCTNSCNYLNAV